MLFQVNTTSTTPLSKQLAHQIESAYQLGHLKAGEAMPSVRALAKELHINPSTVSKAYKSLIAAGLLISKSGLGIYVNEIQNYIGPEKAEGLDKDVNSFLNESIAKGYSMEEIEITFLKELNELRNKNE